MAKGQAFHVSPWVPDGRFVDELVPYRPAHGEGFLEHAVFNHTSSAQSDMVTDSIAISSPPLLEITVNTEGNNGHQEKERIFLDFQLTVSLKEFWGAEGTDKNLRGVVLNVCTVHKRNHTLSTAATGRVGEGSERA